MFEFKKILIVSNSGRMLAKCAKNAGYSPLVIDCFADADTQLLALKYIKVNSLALEFVRPAVSILKSQYKIGYIIYGSGLESNLDTLEFLQQNLSILGNTLDVFTAIQNKSIFFPKLKQLQIPYPEISFQAPDIYEGWLIKPMQGEGGLGIKNYNKKVGNSALNYWQKYISGIPLSVLFVANGAEFKVIGFHKLFNKQINDNAFVFSGLMSQPEISKNIFQSVNQWLARLVPEFTLQGINSLDLIVQNDSFFALEVNARPSASMQLYNEDLLSEHVNSCLMGQLKTMPVLKDYQAHSIMFAENRMFIKQNIQWPLWITDIPQAGSFIHTGLPICSIIAGGENEQQVINLLQSRYRIIQKLLN